MTDTHDTETVERVAKAMWDSRNMSPIEGSNSPSLVEIYKGLARAALSAMPAPKVKPLVWQEAPMNGYKRGRCAAKSPFGSWAAYISRIDGGWQYGGRDFIGNLDEALALAKAAAQADYEARILGAMV